MVCSLDVANLGIRFNPLPHIDTTFINQRRIRPRSVIAFPTSDCLKHRLLRRISCSTVDEQQIQQAFSDAENSLISSLIGIQGRGRSASPQQLKVTPSSSCLFNLPNSMIMTLRVFSNHQICHRL